MGPPENPKEGEADLQLLIPRLYYRAWSRKYCYDRIQVISIT